MSGAKKERQAEIDAVTAKVVKVYGGERDEVVDHLCVGLIRMQTGCSRPTAWRHYIKFKSGITPPQGGKREGSGRKAGSKNKPKETE